MKEKRGSRRGRSFIHRHTVAKPLHLISAKKLSECMSTSGSFLQHCRSDDVHCQRITMFLVNGVLERMKSSQAQLWKLKPLPLHSSEKPNTLESTLALCHSLYIDVGCRPKIFSHVLNYYFKRSDNYTKCTPRATCRRLPNSQNAAIYHKCSGMMQKKNHTPIYPQSLPFPASCNTTRKFVQSRVLSTSFIKQPELRQHHQDRDLR